MTEPLSTDLAIPDELLNPITGELVPTSNVVQVAATLEALREYRDRLNVAIAVFSEPLIMESRRLGTRTLTAGALRAEVSSDHEIEWDLDALAKLLDVGLPQERYDELVRATVTYKVNGTVARQLAGASPEYAAVIERAKVRIPKRQYVTVKP